MLSPALIWPLFDPQAEAVERAVQRRLKRARSETVGVRSALALAAHALGIALPPAAALARLAEGQRQEPHWFLAEPVMLIPDRDRLLLQRLTGAALEPEEASVLIETAHSHFPAGELRIEPAGTGRWYVRLGTAGASTGIAAEAAENQSVEASPEAFGVNREGMRLLNELQMLWFEHPVNLERRRAGRPQANALWVWGGGGLPASAPRVEARALAAGMPELQGLAQWLGLECLDDEAARARPIGPGLVVAPGPDEASASREWLRAFAQQRRPFRLLAAGRAWTVPGRGLWRRW